MCASPMFFSCTIKSSHPPIQKTRSHKTNNSSQGYHLVPALMNYSFFWVSANLVNSMISLPFQNAEEAGKSKHSTNLAKWGSLFATQSSLFIAKLKCMKVIKFTHRSTFLTQYMFVLYILKFILCSSILLKFHFIFTNIVIQVIIIFFSSILTRWNISSILHFSLEKFSTSYSLDIS